MVPITLIPREEFTRVRGVFETRTIAGWVLMPFFTHGDEGFDVNDEYDWMRAECLVQSGQARLPAVSLAPYPLQESARLW